jgi:hypothetical protein
MRCHRQPGTNVATGIDAERAAAAGAGRESPHRGRPPHERAAIATWSGSGSGPAIIAALDQVAEIQGLGLAGLGAEALVPPRRLAELARYGMTADAWLIRRHPDDRRQ